MSGQHGQARVGLHFSREFPLLSGSECSHRIFNLLITIRFFEGQTLSHHYWLNYFWHKSFEVDLCQKVMIRLKKRLTG